MPVSLPFSLSYRQKRKLKSVKSPPPSATTQYSEVIDIYDTSAATIASPSAESFVNSALQDPGPSFSTSPRRHSRSPQVRLNFSSRDLSSSVLRDWFPSDLLHSDAPHPQGSPRSRTDLTHGKEDDQSDNASLYPDSVPSSPADVLQHLEGLDASSFITVETDVENGISHTQQSTTNRKVPPAPLKIPPIHSPTHPSKIQVIRSASTRPQSYISTDETSAVSGTTLARALLGNSYVLSSDSAARHRSGVSVLTRQDSATLPLSDFYTFFSPRGDFSPPLNSSVPLPSNAEFVYSPPKTARDGSSPDDQPLAFGSKKRQQRASTGSMAAILTDTETLNIVNTPETLHRSRSLNGTDRALDTNDLKVPTPRSSRTFGPPSTHLITDVSPTTSSIPPLPSPIIDQTPALAPGQEQGQQPHPKQEQETIIVPSISPVNSDGPNSAKLLENVLDDYYSAESDDEENRPSHSSKVLPSLPPPDTSYRPAFSPITEENSSQLSPVSPRTVGSIPPSPNIIVLAHSPPPQSPLARNNRLSNDRQPPQLPRSRGLTSTNLATLTSQDTSEELLAPSRSSIFTRQRSGSAPSPIRVVRDSKDFSSYNITVSPGPESGLPKETTTPARDTPGEQTFPETPDLLSPGWSIASSSGFTKDAPVSIAPHTIETVVAPPRRAEPITGTNGLLSPGASTYPRRHSGDHLPTQPPADQKETCSQPPTLPETVHQRDSVSVYSSESPLPLGQTQDGQPNQRTSLAESGYPLPSSINHTVKPVTPPPNGLSTQSSQLRPIPSPISPGQPGHSPPPYDFVVQDTSHGVPTPSTGGSMTDRDSRYAFSPRSPSIASSNGRTRVRPAGPLGPRRPSHSASTIPSAGILPSHSLSGHRPRNPSVSSTTSTTAGRHPSLSRSGTATATGAPSSIAVAGTNTTAHIKFDTPPVKWRGYTMEQAKWTFTSSQLQTIVSRAIKQSADPTKIRLLPLDCLDDDIPSELRQLEVRRADIQTKYRIVARKRSKLFATLTGCLAQSDERVVDVHHANRVLEEMQETAITLDGLTEELHSLDEQISQTRILQEVHSASALAMALRKLNDSFLRQLEDVQSLQSRVAAAEMERDDAWRYAESEAFKCDQLLRQRPVASETTTASPNNSNRASRILAARRSSGLRASIAPSRRSSVSSNNRLSISALSSGARSTFSLADVPPVPPMPQLPFGITTDLPNTRTSEGLSSEALTPNSDTLAMKQAQDELYEMLGLTSHGRRRVLSVLSPHETEKIHDHTVSIRPPSDGTPEVPPRPSSLPLASELERTSAREADRMALLTTLEMLSGE